MRGVAVIALFALTACAALQRRALVRFSEERLTRARELHAEQRAPLAFQRFGAARSKAEAAAPESAQRSDYASEARLWLETAVDEAERSVLNQERLALEQATVTLDEAFLKAERERNQRDDERAREAAAGVARLEAERALARAALAPAQRVKLSVKDSEHAARSLLERAELIELALPAALETSARAHLRTQLKDARAQLSKAPELALSSADQALFQALVLLGALRAGEAAPSAESKASLVEALALLGAQLSRNERGLAAALPGASATEARTLERLCSLANAYPQGLVQVTLVGRAGPPEAARKIAEHGCAGERFRAGFAADAKLLSFVFTAY